MASLIDAFDREIIAHVAVAGAGIGGSDIRDKMLAAAERRFEADCAPHGGEHLSDNDSCHAAKETREFATALGLVPCFTPVLSSKTNGMNGSFVETHKRGYVRVTPLPDAARARHRMDHQLQPGPPSLRASHVLAKFRKTLKSFRTLR